MHDARGVRSVGAEGEGEAMRPGDLEVLAGVHDVLSVAPVGEIEPAADPRVDLGPNHLARRRREHEAARLLDVEQRVEDAAPGRRRTGG